MNAFLVYGRDQLYDVPLGVFARRDVAIERAWDVTEAEVIEAIRTVWSIDGSVPLYPSSVGIVEFVDCDPQPFEEIKSFAESEAPADVLRNGSL